MTKIAFFDIDGTMVNVPNGMLHPTEETRRVIQAFREQGNYVVVATARSNAPESVRDIDFDGYICSDGHYIEFQNEVLMNNIFSKDEIVKQLQIYDEHNGAAILGGYEGSWTNSHTDHYLKQHNLLYSGSDDLSTIPLVEDDLDQVKANSITAVFGTSEDLLAAKDKLPKEWAINAYPDDKESIRMDVHLQGFSKGTACEYLYNELKISKENSYAFGDGENDIEMLQLVGNGIAMGNAPVHIQKAAKFLTETVDNEGISKAFKEHLKI